MTVLNLILGDNNAYWNCILRYPQTLHYNVSEYLTVHRFRFDRKVPFDLLFDLSSFQESFGHFDGIRKEIL